MDHTCMPTSRRARPRGSLLAATLALLPVIAPVHAKDYTWTGAETNDADWSSAFNWGPLLNEAGDAFVFDSPDDDLAATRVVFTSIAFRSDANLDTDRQVRSLIFDDDGTFDQAFVLSSNNGSRLTIGEGGIYNASHVNQVINHAIVLGAPQAWEARDGDLIVNGARSGNFVLAIRGSTPGRTVYLGGNGAGHTGDIWVESGTLMLGDVDAISAASTVSVDAGATFNLNHTGETIGGLAGAGNVLIGLGSLEVAHSGGLQFFSGALLGVGAFTKSGSGTLALTGNNAGFNGAVQVNGGTLLIGEGNSLGEVSPVSVAPGATLRVAGGGEDIGSLAGAGSLVLDDNLGLGQNGGDTTYAGVISGGGNLTKHGGGTLSLSGDNTFTGAVSVAAGELRLGLGATLTVQNALTVLGGATLRVADDGENFGSLAGAGSVVLGGDIGTGWNGATTVFSGSISGQGNVTKHGAGILVLNGHNTFDGTLTVAAGTLQIGVDDTLSDQHAVTVDAGATLQIVADEDFGSLAGAGSVALNAHATLGLNGANTAFSGFMFGPGQLTKAGAGTFTLAGNVVVGGIDVDGGTLAVDGGTTSALSGVANIASGATLRVDGGNYVGDGLHNRGRLEVLDGAVDVGPSLANDGAIVIGAAGHLAAGLVNDVDLVAGSRAITVAGTLQADGIAAGRNVVTLAGGTLIADSVDVRQLLVDGDGTLDADALKVVQGFAVLSGAFDFESAGGVLQVTGNYAQQAPGILAVDWGSDGIERLAVSGGATVAGRVQLNLVGGFVPDVGTSVEFLHAASIVGAFDPTVLLSAGLPGRDFSLRREKAGYFLDVTAAPVPLPPAVWLLGAPLAIALGARRRTR
ncbi:MAG: autotransporter-associated beta strand repeat-containing protein [Gammaproteobacteria bacterium]